VRSVGHSVTLGDRRVRLTPGRHASPGDGACVVELASVIAHEKFSDRPDCVCSAIAAFLRGWNDRAAYADRQRLVPYAQRIVGTRESRRLTRERRDMCLEWAGADLQRGRVGRALARLRMRVRIAILCQPASALRLTEGAGEYAARVLYGRRDVEGAFLLLDSMLAIGTRPPQRPDGSPRANGNGYVPSANGNGHLPSANGNGHLPSANGNGHVPKTNGNGNGHVPSANGNASAPPSRVPDQALARR
jgi:hypothetical protein